MRTAFLAIFLLIAASPIFLVLDVSVLRSLITICSAVAIASVAVLRPREAKNVWSSIRIFVPLATIPIVWMILQIVPISFLAHPIWQSAGAALGAPLRGKISADPALTLTALFRFFSVLAIVVATVCVAGDRQRARRLLIALVIVTGLVTITFAVIALGSFRISVELGDVGTASFRGICNLAMVLSAALLADAIDQFLVRRQGTDFRKSRGFVEMWVGGVALAICLATAVLTLPKVAFIAGMCGLALVVLAVFLRYMPGRRWESRTVIATFLIVAAVLVANPFVYGFGDVILRATGSASPSQIAIAERMIADAGPLGTGAGTYAALVPIYRQLDDTSEVVTPPTSAADIAVEFGCPALVMFLAASAFFVTVLFRRALERGRDAAFAAAGAGCALIISLEIFNDASLLGTTVLVLAAITLGLALGQSMSLPRAG